MIVSVFASAWEFDCCHRDATVGQEWSACLYLHPSVPGSPDWPASPAEPPGVEVLDLEVEIIRPAQDPNDMAIVAYEGLQLGVEGLAGTGRQRLQGRIWTNWHGPDQEELEALECHGVVCRVRLVRVAYHRCGDRPHQWWEPAAELPAIDVPSTSDRRNQRFDQATDTSYQDCLLVSLDVATPHRGRDAADRVADP